MPVIVADLIVQSQVNKGVDLTAKKAGDLALATVHLFTNDYTPTPASVVGDFTEAVFTGYVDKAIPGWTANEYLLLGSVTTTGTTVLSWAGPGDATGETIFGYYVLSAGAGTPFIYAARLPEQFALANPANVLDLVPTYVIP